MLKKFSFLLLIAMGLFFVQCEDCDDCDDCDKVDNNNTIGNTKFYTFIDLDLTFQEWTFFESGIKEGTGHDDIFCLFLKNTASIAYFDFTFNKNGIISFYLKGDSGLKFLIDGEIVKDDFEDNDEWKKYTFDVESGEHRFRFEKKIYGNYLYVDEVLLKENEE